jgi:hypothetical protein
MNSTDSSDAEGFEDTAPQQQPQAAAYSMTKGALAQLLQQCPDAAVRQQLHTHVVRPKLQQATRLLGELAR